ncbi:sensor protein [mine drainage metagenome]|uniref:Sensor protein n=1 Tax=mine drainage metagenome TaxID=410659 RepID=T1C1W2_9ZZZZ
MTTPHTIAEYLQQLRAALKGADPAMIQDALFDAEEHLRSELAEHPGESEAAMLARVAGSYGALGKWPRFTATPRSRCSARCARRDRAPDAGRWRASSA